MKIGLQLWCQLESITDLKADGEDFRWYLKLKCLSCGEETPEYVYVTLEEESPLKGGRGHANLVLKCKFCERENSISIIPDSIACYTAADSEKHKTIVAYDCRGVEPVDFSPRTGWVAKGAETTTSFDDISLLEKEWVDYDEKASESVGIYDVKHTFVKLK